MAKHWDSFWSDCSSASSSLSVLHGWEAIVIYAWGEYPSRTFSADIAALALLRESGEDVGEDDNPNIVVFGAPLATSPATLPHSAQPSGDEGERNCCCLLGSGSSIGRNDGDPLWLPKSSSSSEPSAS